MEYPTKEFPSYPPESGTSSCQLPTHFSSLPQHSALSFFPCQLSSSSLGTQHSELSTFLLPLPIANCLLPTILIFPRHSALRTQHFPSSLAHCQLPIAYCQLSSSSLGTQHSELSTFLRLLFEHASLCWTHNCTINTTSPSSSFRGEKPGNPAGG